MNKLKTFLTLFILFAGITSAQTGVFFSEYIEGGGDNKSLEIYNASDSEVDLSNYIIRINYNGNPYNEVFSFGNAKLAAGDVYVIAHEGAVAEITDVADTLIVNPYSGGTSFITVFNGDDVRTLCVVSGTDTTAIDMIGTYDLVDPGAGWPVAGVVDGTKDHTIVRKETVTTGNTNWVASAGTTTEDSEWIVYDKDVVSYLGQHPGEKVELPKVFFSEYIEGGGDNKSLEIYNASDSEVDLSNYIIRINYNGNPYNEVFSFGNAKLTAGDVYVIAHETAAKEITDVADTLVVNPYSGGTSFITVFNGDDVRTLCVVNGTDTTAIDIIGTYDLVDPGAGWPVAGVVDGTKDHTIVRKETVTSGNTNWVASAGTTTEDSEWIVYDKDNLSYIGIHPGENVASVQSYYLAGDFQGWDAASTPLYDDGTNGDLIAEDGIYSLEYLIATTGFHECKATNGTWDVTWPSDNYWFSTTSDAQTVLFTFNTNQVGDGWLPDQYILSTNEVKPSDLVAVGDFQSELGESEDWVNNSTITAMYDDGMNGDLLSGDGIFCYHINTLLTGTYSAKGVKTGEWNGWGADGRSVNAKNIDFTTTSDNQDVYLYVDVNTGRSLLTFDAIAPAELPNLFISEYIEGTSNNKALEIFNGGDTELDLTQFVILNGGNGGYWSSSHTFPVDAKLAAGDVWLMVADQLSATYYDTTNANEVIPYSSSSPVHYNGDDARAVAMVVGTDTTLIDVFGLVDGIDPGTAWNVGDTLNATANHTLVRKSTVTSGQTDWALSVGTDNATSEWEIYAVNTFKYLGQHPGETASDLPNLFISEYIEGSSNNKALEVYNGSDATINLTDFVILNSHNADGWSSKHLFPTGATLASHDVWVMAADEVSSDLFDLDNADEVIAYSSASPVHFNGDDARALAFINGTDTTIIDVIGVSDVDPGTAWDVGDTLNATTNHTIVRKSTVTSGQTDWALSVGTDNLTSEWEVYAQNTFKYLGQHPGEKVKTPIYFSNFEADFGDWTGYTVASTNAWVQKTGTGANGTAGYAEMNGYQEDVISNDYLIAGPFDLDNFTEEYMDFWAAAKYGDFDKELTLEYSTDYDGTSDPSTFTWTELTFTRPVDNNDTWTNSGMVSLSEISSDNVYLSFHYLSDGTKGRWKIDEVAIYGKPVEGVDLPPVVESVVRNVNVPTADQNTEVTATVTDDNGLTSVTLVYSTDGLVFNSVAMSNTEGDIWVGEIVAATYNDGDLFGYYVAALDIAGQSDTSNISMVYAGNTPIENIKMQMEDGSLEFIGAAARVTGTVSAGSGTYSTGRIEAYIEDATAGVLVIAFGTETPAMVNNNNYTVTGKIIQYNGLIEVEPFIPSEDIIDNGSVTPLVPMEVSLADINSTPEDYESRLIKVTGVELSSETPWLDGSSTSGSTMNIFIGTDTLALRVDADTDIWGSASPTFPQDIVGVLGQYDFSSPYNSGYQLLPRRATDFETGVGVDDKNGIPTVYALEQNYPNPFNPTTKISFSLPESGMVTLKVYDILGKEVMTLVNEVMPASYNNVEFDASQLSTGIYLYRIQANNFVSVKKMMLLK